MPNRNRFYYEIDRENRSRLSSMLWSFAILLAAILMVAFILYMPTNKRIMAPIESFQTTLKSV